jgi:hypothetical protein
MNVPKPPKWLLGILALAVLIAAARIENSGKPADIERCRSELKPWCLKIIALGYH